jgi:glycosyltransferase involved in cell wall biosynthesis
MPDVGIVFGTYNRLPLLQVCISSLRPSVGSLSYEIVVVDGGSSDGTQHWARCQPDVVLIEQTLPLTGAVIAYNLGFARAISDGCQWVTQFNDDIRCVGDEPEIEHAVWLMQSCPSVGAVAFESDIYHQRDPSRPDYDCAYLHGVPHFNLGVVRREAGMSAARAMGDSSGTAWWCRDHHTYGADTELTGWLVRLGWEIHHGAGLCVKEAQPYDAMAKANRGGFTTEHLCNQRWGQPASLDYSREAAERFGGVVR